MRCRNCKQIHGLVAINGNRQIGKAAYCIACCGVILSENADGVYDCFIYPNSNLHQYKTDATKERFYEN